MSGYTKLFSSILTSTIWREPKEVKILWITMLAMSGKDGRVEGSVPGIATMAGLSIEETSAALKQLQGPDFWSRTKDFEGRRIKEVDGGWQLLNHAKYRALLSAEERREYNRQKQAEHRAAKKPSMTVNDMSARHMVSGDASESDSDAKPPTDAEVIYELYPRKEGRKAALKAINRALNDREAAFLIEATTAYSRAVKLWPTSETKFIPHPATWFNRGSYDDDRATWQRKSNAHDQRPNSRRYAQTDDYSKLPTKHLGAAV